MCCSFFPCLFLQFLQFRLQQLLLAHRPTPLSVSGTAQTLLEIANRRLEENFARTQRLWAQLREAERPCGAQRARSGMSGQDPTSNRKRTGHTVTICNILYYSTVYIVYCMHDMVKDHRVDWCVSFKSPVIRVMRMNFLHELLVAAPVRRSSE